jgi:steroid 5-alpha reductase family enzyme
VVLTEPGFSVGNLVVVSGLSLLAVAVLMTVTALVGRRQGRVSVVDTAWGLGFVVVAVVAAAAGSGELWRRLLLLALVAVWGGRLARHMQTRNQGKGEDPRYEAMLAKEPGNPFLVAVRKVYLVQGVAVWFVSLPIQVSAAAGGGVLPVAVVGVLLWALGVTFEAVGDAQLKRFKADAANQGKIMDRGLWAWTRHPNYFGDSNVWWGLFLVVASAWPGVLTVLSPVVMTYFLVFATGARLLEKQMAQRPGYRDYQQRTSYFLPRPPRRV